MNDRENPTSDTPDTPDTPDAPAGEPTTADAPPPAPDAPQADAPQSETPPPAPDAQPTGAPWGAQQGQPHSQPGPQPGPQPGAFPGSQPSPGYPGAPAPMLESTARTISMLIHILSAVAALLSAGLLAFVVPLVMWLIYRERSALIDHHGKLNLNLQLTMLTVVVGGVVVGLVTVLFGFTITIPLMIAYLIYSLVMVLIAGVRANEGEYYKIPLVIRYIR